jgi:hypothetical protein
MTDRLKALRGVGLVASVKTEPHDWSWVPAEDELATRHAAKERARDSRRRAWQRGNAKRALARAIISGRPAFVGRAKQPDEFVHRCVSAAKARRPRVMAPRSVFDLARARGPTSEHPDSAPASHGTPSQIVPGRLGSTKVAARPSDASNRPFSGEG